MRTYLTAFFLFVLLMSSFYLDVWKNANTTSRALPVITYFERGTFQIDKYHELTVDKAFVNGHYYTDKAPLPTYLMVPFFGLLKGIGLIQPDADGNLFGDHIYILGGFLTASLPFAIMLLLLFRTIKNKAGRVSPVLLATLPFMGSFVFVFTGTYFAHILSAVLLLVSYIMLRKGQFLWAGLAGGLAFLCEYNLAVILLLWGLMVLARERKARPFLQFSLGILPALLFMVYYNSLFSSSPFTFMYKHHNFSELDSNYGFVTPGLDALFGLSLSPYRGIFFYSPFLIAGCIVIYRMIRRNEWKSLSLSYLFIPFLLYYLFIASYFAWWGGWTYGPRLLLAMVLILLYKLIGYAADKGISKPLFMLLCFAGLLLIIPAKGTIAYSAPTGIMNPFYELVIGGIRNGVYNPNNILTILWGVRPGVAFLVYLSLLTTGMSAFTLWFARWQKS
jgi:hypothetical protein